MKNIAILAIASVIGFSGAAFAQADSDAKTDLQEDHGAIHKDNKALEKDQNTLETRRAAKAADKANGNYGKQAVDSVAIGVDHTMIGEKKAEKAADKKILEQDKKDVNAAKEKGDNY